jgi:Plavaka transposase
MLEAHKKLPKLPDEPHVETVVAAFMFWSDSTHLANFRTASLWPLYTFFGNQSKYTRAKPTSRAAHHQAYIPSLPDNIQEEYTKHYGKAPSAAMLTHLKRELMHAVWNILLSLSFIEIYIHGLLIKCHDGVIRRVFPQFFTYAADYPEKYAFSLITRSCPSIYH